MAIKEYVLCDKADLVNIADAVRQKTGSSDEMRLSDFTQEMGDIIDGNSLIDRSIEKIASDTITRIGAYAFSHCEHLTEASFPNVTYIGSYAFSSTAIKRADFPLLKAVSGSGWNNSNIFYFCLQLSEINFPELINTSTSMFARTGLKTVTLPKVQEIETSTFDQCSSLTGINCPSATEIGMYAFQDCKSLKDINLPQATMIRQYAFNGCGALTDINFPNLTNMEIYAFLSCKSLKSAMFDKLLSIPSTAFYSCTSFDTLVLKSENVCALANVSAFSGTPFAAGGTGGIVWVPQALIESYQTETNWSSLCASGSCSFLAYDKCYLFPIKPESMRILYNQARTISTKYSIPLGNESTPSITVTSSDTSIVSISDVVISGNDITFNINSLDKEGEVMVTIELTLDGETVTSSVAVAVLAAYPPCSYTVENVDGSSYGFSLNDSGYYESNNKGKNNSFAICKVSFYSNGEKTMNVNCINYAESNFDYGILSTIDSTLQLSSSADSANVFKSFKGASAESVQIVNYGVIAEGEHFMYIKFIKDSSTSKNNDTLQFNIEFVD